MKKQNIFKYSVLAIALILSSLRLHPCLNILSIYFACLFIAINLNKKKIIQYSLFLFLVSIILKVVLNVNNHYFSENFDGKTTNEGETAKDETTHDGETTPEGGTSSGKTPKDEISKGEISKGEIPKGEIPKGETSKDETSTTNQTDTLNHNNLTDEEKQKLNITETIDDEEKNEQFNSNDMNIITPAQAQRELYRLVDTTSLLTKTMNELSPILSEGKNIMNTLEQLNLTSKLQK